VLSNLGESFGVLVSNQLLSINADFDSPSLNGLLGASTRLLDIVDCDCDLARLLASGDSVVQDSDVVVDSVFSDGRVPNSHLAVDFGAWARLVVDLNDFPAGLLADGMSLVPDTESLLVESLDLDSNSSDFLVVLLDLDSPLLQVVVVAVASLVLHDDDRLAGS
jgi:hypothetical protein